MGRKLEEVGDRVTNNQGFSGTIAELLTGNVEFFSQSRVVIDFDSGYRDDYSLINVRRGRFYDYGQPNKVGGYSFKPDDNPKKEYFLWYNILSRCNDPNDKDYKNYGARGVRVSERWHHLENFIKDIKEIDGYDRKIENPDEYTLDKDSKIPGNLLYSKDTCLFIDKKEQAENSRGTIPILCLREDGLKTVYNSIAEAGRETGICISSIGKGLRNKDFYNSKGYNFTRLGDGLDE